MKAMTWNLGHRTQQRTVPRSVVDAVERSGVELVAFNEFVDDGGRAEFYGWLDAAGYSHRLLSPPAAKNQVLVASKTPIQQGDVDGPDTTGPAIAGWLHVTVPEHRLELISYRMPSYDKGSAEKADYLLQLGTILGRAADRPLAIAGDFNINPFETDPASTRTSFPGADGWTVANPEGDWSWHSGTASNRLDFVATTASVEVTQALYAYEVGGITLANETGTGLSDHAALVFEVAGKSSDAIYPHAL